MDKRTYIQTDDITMNLVELLLLKIDGLEQKVYTLSNPIHTAQLYNEKEAAKILKISSRALYTLRTKGKISFRDLDIGIRYRMDDIMEFEDICQKSKA